MPCLLLCTFMVRCLSARFLYILVTMFNFVVKETVPLMANLDVAEEALISGLKSFIGIPLSKLRYYAEKNNVMDIIDHPYVLQMTDRQLDKLSVMRDFINAWQVMRMHQEETEVRLDSIEAAKRYFITKLAYHMECEYVLAAYASNKGSVLAYDKISSGGLDYTFLNVGYIAKRALYLDATSVYIAHNHPSLYPEPSREDIAITARLYHALELLSIRLLDHIIVGTTKQVYSMHEHVDIWTFDVGDTKR